MKKIFVTLFVVLLLLTGILLQPMEAKAASVDDLTYEIENGEVTVTGCSTSASGELVIPETIKGYPVTRIGGNAFYHCTGLTDITVPDSVNMIGEGAFYGCTSLETMTLPFVGDRRKTAEDSYQYPFGYIFGSNGAVVQTEQYYYESSPTSSRSNQFWIPASLKSVTITGGEILYGAFSNCKNLQSITLPNSATAIGKSAFFYCTSLQTLNIPSGITSIDEKAFYHCANLQSVSIPNGTATIGNSAFCGCSSLTEITIPGSVAGIGESAFTNCSDLRKITILDGVATIGKSAFSGCGSVKSIVVPNSVTAIGESAFRGCVSLESITLPFVGLNRESNLPFGYFFGKDSYSNCTKTVQKYSTVSGVYTGTYYIPDSLKSVTVTDDDISYGAFYQCKNLTSVTFGDGVGKIGAYAFFGCSGLQNINFGNGVEKMANYSFHGCTGLQKLTIGDNVTEIGHYAFGSCKGLTSVTIPTSVRKVINSAFAYCEKLEYVYYLGSADDWYHISIETFNNSDFINAVRIYTPEKPYKIANVVNGVHVFWNEVAGAQQYGVWRSETGKDGTYKWLGSPTVPHFTDVTVESGKTYYYKITMVNSTYKVHGEKSEALGITFVETPVLSGRANIAAGIRLSWNKVNGATGYAIYRKSYSGNDAWVRVGTVSGNATFTWTDTSVKNNNGTAYKYTIRALSGNILSGCRATGMTMVRLTSQTLSSAVATSDTSIKCAWTTSKVVDGYEVRFMVGDQVYKTYPIGNYKMGAKTFTALKDGETYKVQVRTFKKVAGVGIFYSAWSVAQYVTT